MGRCWPFASGDRCLQCRLNRSLPCSFPAFLSTTWSASWTLAGPRRLRTSMNSKCVCSGSGTCRNKLAGSFSNSVGFLDLHFIWLFIIETVIHAYHFGSKASPQRAQQHSTPIYLPISFCLWTRVEPGRRGRPTASPRPSNWINDSRRGLHFARAIWPIITLKVQSAWSEEWLLLSIILKYF